MSARANQPLPLARKDALIVQELPDEVLVYDLDRHKAHCLNKTSALVWKHCDGKTTVAQVTQLLERELATLIDTDVVWLALSQLRRYHLLEEGKATIGMMKVTRRDVVTKYLPAALALPVIISIASPAAAQASSRPCSNNGGPCTTSADCCPGTGLGCNTLSGICQFT
jgi:hypothetical protein